MPVRGTLTTGKAKRSLGSGRQAVNIRYSAAALNNLIGGTLALASWAFWAGWNSPQQAGARRVMLALIPFVWIAVKLWLSRRCSPDDSAPATNPGRLRRWKLGLATLASLICVLCWYAWSSVWLSSVPQLSTAPRMWQALVYFSQLLHQSILPAWWLVFITSFPLIVWFFGDSGLELFLGIATTAAAWDGILGAVPASSAANLIVPLCALGFMLRVRKLRAESSCTPLTSGPALVAAPVRRQRGNGTPAAKQFCCPSVQV